MKTKNVMKQLFIVLTAFLLLVACTSSGTEEDASHDHEEGSNGEMEHMEEGEEMEGMENDEDMDHEHDDDHGDRIPNEDDSKITIISPESGAMSDGNVVIEVEIENFELANEGSHWHVYVDGVSYGMVMGQNFDQPLNGLEPGHHTIEAYLANGDHQEFQDGASVEIMVEE